MAEAQVFDGLARLLWVIAALLGVFAVLEILAGMGIAGYRWNYLHKAVKSEAVITELIEPTGSADGSTFAPVYEFEDQRGQSVTITSSYSSRPPVGREGEAIDILYLPSDPKNALIDRFFPKWGLATLLVGFGLVELMVAAGLFFASKKLNATNGRRIPAV